MKRNLKNVPSKIAFCVALTAITASAQSSSTSASASDSSPVDDHFRVGWHEATAGSGVFFSNLLNNYNRPNIDYVTAYLQAGYMITEPHGDKWWRGNLEVAPEIFGAGIYSGPGSYVAGGTIWLRYNFIPPGWKLVPYLEGGAGLTSLDIPHNYDGKDFNFNLDAAAGLRYFILPRCSLNVEYRFQHISNADMWDRNVGVNSGGPSLGVSFFF